jgi:hypothetical protein
VIFLLKYYQNPPSHQDTEHREKEREKEEDKVLKKEREKSSMNLFK